MSSTETKYTTGWPCEIVTADFGENTVTVEMQCSDYHVAAGLHYLVPATNAPERTPMDRFENAIREVGIVAACEWFGHHADSEFTKESIRVLNERATGEQP